MATREETMNPNHQMIQDLYIIKKKLFRTSKILCVMQECCTGLHVEGPSSNFREQKQHNVGLSEALCQQA